MTNESYVPASGVQYPAYQPPPQGQYKAPTPPLYQLLDLIIESPSIPPALKYQYFVFWEEVKTGNFDALDMLRLRAKFKRWTIFLLWFIPEQEWGNIILIRDTPKAGETINLEMDINMLLKQLEIFFDINISKGRDGFFMRELNTIRSKNETEYKENYITKQKPRLI